MVFVISFPFLLIRITCFSVGTENVMSFSVFSPKQIIFPQVLMLALLLKNDNHN